MRTTNLIVISRIGNPNSGIEVEQSWMASSSPDYEYLSITGQESLPKMEYDPDMKERSLRWLSYFEKLYDRYNQTGLSNVPVSTASDIAAKHFLKVYSKNTEL